MELGLVGLVYRDLCIQVEICVEIRIEISERERERERERHWCDGFAPLSRGVGWSIFKYEMKSIFKG